MGLYAVSVLGDGDFCMGATAIWTAVRHRIPLLILIDNNRSYFNDELHQDNVARRRGREPRTAGLACAWKTRCRTSPRWPKRKAPSVSAHHQIVGRARRDRAGRRHSQTRRRLRDRLPRRPQRRPHRLVILRRRKTE